VLRVFKELRAFRAKRASRETLARVFREIPVYKVPQGSKEILVSRGQLESKVLLESKETPGHRDKQVFRGLQESKVKQESRDKLVFRGKRVSKEPRVQEFREALDSWALQVWQVLTVRQDPRVIQVSKEQRAHLPLLESTQGLLNLQEFCRPYP
jgi:hypothetical protein